MGRKINNFSSH